jgi:hypothetical protein
MAHYKLGYDGKWQERFDDRETAIRRAEEVASTGEVVEVVTRRFGFHSFLTAFPESEREALRARWKVVPWIGDSPGANAGHHHHYGSIHGGGGGHGGSHGGHGGGH